MRATPDLVVEVLSPSETAAELEDKVDDYRTAGTRLFLDLHLRDRTPLRRFGSLVILIAFLSRKSD